MRPPLRRGAARTIQLSPPGRSSRLIPVAPLNVGRPPIFRLKILRRTRRGALHRAPILGAGRQNDSTNAGSSGWSLWGRAYPLIVGVYRVEDSAN